MRKISLFLLLLLPFQSPAQQSPNEWDDYISSIDFLDMANKDSLPGWSEKLAASGYPRAEAYALRLKGFYEDYNDNRSEALDWYLKFMEATKTLGNPDDELSAVSDLVYTYIHSARHLEAKKQILSLLNRRKTSDFSPKRLAILYNNLGQCYQNEQKMDSALIYYERSLKIKEEAGDQTGIANSKINLASLNIKLQNYQQALQYSNENISYLQNKPSADLWYNLINKAGALSGLNRDYETKETIQQALKLAESLDSKSLIQQSHEWLAAAHKELGEFEAAFEELTQSNTLKSELLNEQTSQKIAELQEAYNAEERENENRLLSTQIESQKNRQLALIIGILALTALAGIIGFAYRKNRKKNALIEAQNEKLTQLNTEKNHLMSVVSHDLSSPFSAIKLWAQGLKESSEKELKEAEEMISKTADFGLQTIKSILTIDKDELHGVQLQKVDLADLTRDLMTRFKPLAEAKEINLKVSVEQDRETLLTDRSLLFRALENLLSNAIKYSNQNSEVIFRTYETGQSLCFEVKDFGKGISESEQKTLFDRYQTTDNKPTAGESSHGLGLHIVKRIAGELGGIVKVESERGKGSVFRLILPV